MPVELRSPLSDLVIGFVRGLSHEEVMALATSECGVSVEAADGLCREAHRLLVVAVERDRDEKFQKALDEIDTAYTDAAYCEDPKDTVALQLKAIAQRCKLLGLEGRRGSGEEAAEGSAASVALGAITGYLVFIAPGITDPVELARLAAHEVVTLRGRLQEPTP